LFLPCQRHLGLIISNLLSNNFHGSPSTAFKSGNLVTIKDYYHLRQKLKCKGTSGIEEMNICFHVLSHCSSWSLCTDMLGFTRVGTELCTDVTSSSSQYGILVINSIISIISIRPFSWLLSHCLTRSRFGVSCCTCSRGHGA